MKILTLVFVFLILLGGCKTRDDEKSKTGTNDDSNIFIENNEKSEAKNNLLNGVWAENNMDNALFFIKDENLYYTEDQDNAIPIELKGDTLIIRNEVAVYCKILKLTNDTLWFIDQFSNDTTRLIKR